MRPLPHPNIDSKPLRQRPLQSHANTQSNQRGHTTMWDRGRDLDKHRGHRRGGIVFDGDVRELYHGQLGQCERMFGVGYRA